MSTSARVNHEAQFYRMEGQKARCLLCPHGCLIGEGLRGICGVRKHIGQRLYALTYGFASSVHPDPIEKKPLYHFLPGTTALSLGSVGCNLSCLHCQNYSISRADPTDSSMNEVTPEDIVRYAEDAGAQSISWTYNEPTIWHEFTTAASKEAHRSGLRTSYVTNGYIEEDPLRDLKGTIDAMNIDVKAFNEEFYKRVCGGRLEPVKRACEIAHELGIHIELTYLVIPGHNDSEGEISAFSEWVRDRLAVSVPVHFSAFHPDYRLRDAPRTPLATMEMAYDTASRAGLVFVYIGNVFAGDKEDTVCPVCGSKAVERDGFSVTRMSLHDGCCGECGASLNIIV